MAGCGRENLEVIEDMGKDEMDTGTGVCHPTSFRDVLQGGGADGPTIRVIDLGDDSHREAAKETGVWEMVVHNSVDRNGWGVV